MPRIRSVHPEVCSDEALAEVSAYAERTFVRLWTHLDDEGRALDNPKLLASTLYPLHDDMSADELDDDLTELCAAGLVQRYDANGKRYLSAKPDAWRRFQKPRHPTPSKYPPPPEDYAPPTAVRRNAPAASRSPHAGVEWSGVDGSGDGGGGVDAAPSPESDFHKVARAACRLLAERAADNKPRTDRSRYVTAVAAGKLNDHGDMLSLLATKGTWTPEQLAEALEPSAPTLSAVPEPKPLDTTAAAQAANFDRNAARLKDPCGRCSAVGMVDDEDGNYATCDVCGGSGVKP